MRSTTIGMVAAVALALTACGNSKSFTNSPTPPVPVNLTVNINNSRVSVSPSTVGAGPVVFFVSNHSSNAETIEIQSAGSTDSQPLAATGPISPLGTAQVSVNLKTPGDYTVSIGRSGSTDAALAQPASIQPATVHIGPERETSRGLLMQP